MKTYTEKLHQELLSKLEEFDGNYDPLSLVDPRKGFIINTINLIKEKLKEYQFDNTEEEICYFKSVLPPTLAIYFYYDDKIEWDRIVRQGSIECRNKFIDRVYSQMDEVRKIHTTFREYYRDGETGLDNFYFTRSSPVNRERKYRALRTIDYSTPPLYCEVLAMLTAYNRLEYELKMSESKNNPIVTSGVAEEGAVFWTGTKIGGCELIYALKHSGLVNNGNISLYKIQICLEKAFSVKFGNITKQYQDIQSRKTENHSVIDKLKDGLIRANDDIEQEYERKRRSPNGNPGLR